MAKRLTGSEGVVRAGGPINGGEFDPLRDDENARGATSGEAEFYGPQEYDANRPRRGPLAGIDLLHYCRTGLVRRYDGRPLTPEQAALR